MTRTIKPPYQLIEFSGGGLTIGGYAQLKGFLPLVTLLTSIGGLKLGGRTSALMPVGDRGGLRLGGRARSPILVGQYSPALARFGSTAGMTTVVNSPNTQGSQYLPDIGFSFPLYGATYRSNIAISSNWALLFGFSALAATDISRTVPGQAFLMAASRARSWDRVLVKADNSYSYRIRFEAQIGFGSSPVYNIFETTLYSDGSIQLVCGTNFDFNGFSGAPRVRSLTKGDNVSYADFNTPSGYYSNYPDTDSINAGVEASFVFTPDDTAANSHTVRVGSYPALAPKISRGGLLLGGQAIAVPNLATSTPRSYGGLRLGGRSVVFTPPSSIGGLRLGGRSSVTPVFAFSSAISALQDSTGMTQVVSSYADDASQYLPDAGFDFPIYGSTYRSNIAIGSNWYLLFGLTSIDYSVSRTVPGRGLLFGATDRSWEKVYFKAELGFCRIRFEGHINYQSSSATAIFQIKLFADGTIELTIGIGCFYNSPGAAIQTLTKGDGITYTDFTVPAGSAAQTDFTSTAVLTSLVFRPVDAIGSSHTVQSGSYLSNASAGISGTIVQPQILAGALSVGIAPVGLSGAISQPQTLSGFLAVGSAIAGNISQPQLLTGGLVAGASLSSNISQLQALIGGLSVARSLVSSISQSQSLSGSLYNVPSGLTGAIVQPQTLTGGLSVAVPLIGNISQSQTLSGSLVVGRALSASINQPQTLTGSLNAAVALTGLVNQPQTLAGSLSIGNTLIGSVTQSQNLVGALNVAAALSASIAQPQILTGNINIGVIIAGAINQTQSITGLLSISKALASGVSQPQTLTGSVTASSGLNAPINQPQTLAGSLSIGNTLIGSVTQSQNLVGALNVAAALSASIAQPQSLAGSVSISAALIGSVTQFQALNGSLVVASALSASITQPQSLAGSLSLGNALIGSVTQSQALSGLLVVSSALSAPITQPQTIAGSLSIAAPLSGITSQPQVLAGSLIVAVLLASNISQSQALSGSLSVSNLLTSSVSQPQALAGSLIVAAPLASNINQSQSLSGGLSVAKSLASGISQPQTLIGGLSVAAPLASNINQSQSLSGGLSVAKSLASSIIQPQTLTSGLSIVAPLASNINQSQSLSGLLSSLPSGLSSAIVQPQSLAGDLSVAIPLFYRSAIVATQGRTGLTTLVSAYADDANKAIGDIGFDFPLYGVTYRSNIFAGSNGYLTFGFGSNAYANLSRTAPGRALMVMAADKSWNYMGVQQGTGSFRIRWEGFTDSTNGGTPMIWEATLFASGVIQLAINLVPVTGINTLTKGDDTAFADYTPNTASSFDSLVFTPNDAAGNSHTVQRGSYS